MKQISHYPVISTFQAKNLPKITSKPPLDLKTDETYIGKILRGKRYFSKTSKGCPEKQTSFNVKKVPLIRENYSLQSRYYQGNSLALKALLTVYLQASFTHSS